MTRFGPQVTGTEWIEALSDGECAEIFWLYVDGSPDFLDAHPPALLGRAMRFALRRIAESSDLDR